MNEQLAKMGGRIHATAVIEPGAVLGADVSVGPFCHVGAGTNIGDGASLISHVVISGRTNLGAGSVVHPFAVLGGPPQHLAHKGEETRLEIGQRNVIREHVSMHAGTVAGGGVTRVGDNGFFMAGSHVAHDCHLGDQVVIANGVAIGGHVEIGDSVFLGGLCAIHQFSRIGDFAYVGGCAAVTGDIIPYASAYGNHAVLTGLNIVGMKRRGMSRPIMHAMRAAYRDLFAHEGAFSDRIAIVADKYGHHAEVQRILDFIAQDAKRPLMAPRR